MIINCTWARYNYDIFKLGHQQQQQSCSPEIFEIENIYMFLIVHLLQVLESLGKEFNLFELCLYSHFFFWGHQIGMCKHLFHVFTFSIQEPDHLGGLLLGRRMRSSTCSHAGTTCAFVHTDLLSFISWFPISLNTSNSIYHWLEMDTLHKRL